MEQLPPAPLDAHATAKPDEPVWTLQGGDPLAPPLLRLWAALARVRAGVTRGDTDNFYPVLEAAIKSPVDRHEIEDLLIRATQTEQISWQMDDYLKGRTVEQVAEEKRKNALERLDIYDVRRRCASTISSFFSELNDFREELIKHEWLTEELNNKIEGTILGLRSIEKAIGISK